MVQEKLIPSNAAKDPQSALTRGWIQSERQRSIWGSPWIPSV